MTQQTIGFIGAGNMARSLAGGLLANGWARADLVVSDPDPQQRQAIETTLGLRTYASNSDCAAHAQVLVLAVKPQVLKSVARDLAASVQAKKPLVISIAAGVRTEAIERWLGGGLAVVRAMPNTPALVGSGASGLYANARVGPEQRDLAEALLRAVGVAVWLDREDLLDAVTAVSGSGPAYFFLFIEALEAAAMHAGLDRATARLLTLQTAYGAAKMALESGEEPAQLRRRVTSPGGTTEQAIKVMEQAIDIARREGIIGVSVLGSGRAFDLEVRMGAGAYVCGEETSLLNSLEGKRGTVRAKPPLPALQGLFGKPTVVNNVISLASIPVIMDLGAAFYRDFGVGRSHGTIPIQLAGNIRHSGLYETAFGLPLGQLVNDIGGGTITGRSVKAVQVGGPLGAYFPVSLFDTIFDYEAFTAAGGLIGHAGIVVFDDTADMLHQARFALEFCAVESCGKCTPCRIGSTRGVETVDRIALGIEREKNTALLEDLCETMKFGSLCALGGFTPYPVMSALRHFPDDFAPIPRVEAAE